MSGAKFTPGEWSVLEHDGEVFVLADGAMQVAAVTYVIEHAGEQGSRRLQNARVMAAAPSMAAALMRLCKSFPTDTDMLVAGWDSAEISEACDAYDHARAVLAKALGSTAC